MASNVLCRKHADPQRLGTDLALDPQATESQVTHLPSGTRVPIHLSRT